jgi:hypothetical protein
MTDHGQTEYQALRDTIRERGTARLCAVLAGFVGWGALAIALLITELEGAITLAPFVVLVATFEINFFIHTGVERIGRYLQVFYEERSGSIGWETTAMNFGAKFPSGLDPLFAVIFATTTALNFLSSLTVAQRRPGWVALSLLAHLAFAYRIVAARKLAASQRALDLERFRALRPASN